MAFSVHEYDIDLQKYGNDYKYTKDNPMIGTKIARKTQGLKKKKSTIIQLRYKSMIDLDPYHKSKEAIYKGF